MNVIDDIATKTSKLMSEMGYREKRIRVPFIVRDKSRYDAHQGKKERERRKRQLSTNVKYEVVDKTVMSHGERI